MKKNKSGLSLIIAIAITLVMSLLVLYLLEYIIPFSKNTKNIEQSVQAYYQADSGIEDGLYKMKINSGDIAYEYSKLLSGNKDYSVSMNAKGNNLPRIGEGNSEFLDINNKTNYNIIRIGEPIQIEIGNNSINITNFKIYFRVPDLNNSNNNEERLKHNDLNGNNIKYINWQLSGESDVLNSDNSQLLYSDIDGNEIKFVDNNIKNGLKLHDSTDTFLNFYSYNCGTGKSCKLKLSIINELLLVDGTNVPYLEWRIDAGSSIPLRYRVINTTGKSYGFQKKLRIKVPQQTLNETFDFTVFQ